MQKKIFTLVISSVVLIVSLFLFGFSISRGEVEERDVKEIGYTIDCIRAKLSVSSIYQNLRIFNEYAPTETIRVPVSQNEIEQFMYSQERNLRAETMAQPS